MTVRKRVHKQELKEGLRKWKRDRKMGSKSKEKEKKQDW